MALIKRFVNVHLSLTHCMALSFHFYTPWKYKNQKFSNVFRGSNKSAAWNGLNHIILIKRFANVFQLLKYITSHVGAHVINL